MVTRVLHGTNFFKHFWKGTTQGTSLWSFIKIGQAVKEEMSFEAIVDVFPIYPNVKPNDPQGVANFDPRGIIWTILVEDH